MVNFPVPLFCCLPSVDCAFLLRCTCHTSKYCSFSSRRHFGKKCSLCSYLDGTSLCGSKTERRTFSGTSLRRCAFFVAGGMRWWIKAVVPKWLQLQKTLRVVEVTLSSIPDLLPLLWFSGIVKSNRFDLARCLSGPDYLSLVKIGSIVSFCSS